MKIGILTHHYVKNFGAFMQAYALTNVIKEIVPNSRVEIIDYRVKKHEIMNSLHFFGFKPKRGDTFCGYIDKVCLFFKHYKYEITLPRSKRVYTANDINFIGYDLIIVGADEVWNFKDVAYDSIKFGYGLKGTLISYSACAGGSSDDSIIPNEIKEGIKNFKAISVRDKDSEKLVNVICKNQFDVMRTLDPIFLYDYNLKIKSKIVKIVKVKRYILIYDCHLTELQIKNIIEFAKKNDLNILGAGEYRKWYTSVQTENISPFEWAFLFKNAWGVITGTFHGTSFAIKYNRNFVSFLTEKNRISKVESLLDELALLKQAVYKENEKDLIPILCNPVDYSVVNKLLNKKINDSKDYLKRSILKEGKMTNGQCM